MSEQCSSCAFWMSGVGDWSCEECDEPTCERCGRLDHVEEVFLCPECFCKEGPKKMASSCSKPTIYLAGGMEKAGEYGAIWRSDMTPHLEGLGYHVWNPYTEEMNVGVNVESLSEFKATDYATFTGFCKKIVDYDLSALAECSAVAVRIDESVLRGAGTYGEVTVCRLCNIPVYAWIDLPNGRYDVPGWAMGCLTEYTYDKEEFYSTIPSAQLRVKQPYEAHLDEYISEWAKRSSHI